MVTGPCADASALKGLWLASKCTNMASVDLHTVDPLFGFFIIQTKVDNSDGQYRTLHCDVTGTSEEQKVEVSLMVPPVNKP